VKSGTEFVFRRSLEYAPEPVSPLVPAAVPSVTQRLAGPLVSSALETARNVLKISSPYIRGQRECSLVGSRPVRRPDGAAPFSGQGTVTLVKPGLLARVWLVQFTIRAEAALAPFVTHAAVI
jgi:hypothetical protein